MSKSKSCTNGNGILSGEVVQAMQGSGALEVLIEAPNAAGEALLVVDVIEVKEVRAKFSYP